jgi:hypothetical protein
VASVNSLLVDESIRHSVDLAKYSNNVVRRIMAVLNYADHQLFTELMAALDRMDPASFTVERLESMLGSVRATNAAAYAQVGQLLRDELRDFTAYEVSYQLQMLESMLPVSVHVASVSVESIYTAAMARPFQGVLLKGILSDLETGAAKKIRQTVAMGFVESKTTDQIVRQLRGTKARGYEDGLMAGSRRDVEAVTRTALGHMAGFVQDRTTEANVSLIKALRWSSHLDLRTTPICRVRDGKLYEPESHKPIGHSLPWGAGPGRAHWNCRSAQIYVMKSNAELGIDAPDVVMKGGTRASMDGQLPKDTTYGEWLAKQSAGRQDDVLGPTRAKLLRDGKLPMEAMYSQRGQFLTIEELRAKDAAAFKRAGL